MQIAVYKKATQKSPNPVKALKTAPQKGKQTFFRNAGNETPPAWPSR